MVFVSLMVIAHAWFIIVVSLYCVVHHLYLSYVRLLRDDQVLHSLRANGYLVRNI